MDEQRFSVICTVPVEENTFNYLENTLFGIRDALQATNSNLSFCDVLIQDSCQTLTLKTVQDSSTQTTINEQVHPIECPYLVRVSSTGCQTTPELSSSYVQTLIPVENDWKLDHSQKIFVPRPKYKMRIHKQEVSKTKKIRKLKRELAKEKKVSLKAAAKSFRLKLSALRLGCLALSIECGYQDMLVDLGSLLQQLLVLHGYTSTILSLSNMAEVGNWYYKIRQLSHEAIKSGIQKLNGDSKKHIHFELPKYMQHGEYFYTDSCNKDLVYSREIQPENTVDVILTNSEENQHGKNRDDNHYKFYYCRDCGQHCLEPNHTEVKGSDSCTSTYTSLLLNNQVDGVCSGSCSKDASKLKRKDNCYHKCCAASVPTRVNVSVSSLHPTGNKQSEYILEPMTVSSSSDPVPKKAFSDNCASQKCSTSTDFMPDVTEPSINANDIKYQLHISTSYGHIINQPDDITVGDDQTFNSIPSYSLNSSCGINQVDRSIQDGLHTLERVNINNGNQCLLQRFEKIFNELKNNILKDCG